jgi:hypothetical protein
MKSSLAVCVCIVPLFLYSQTGVPTSLPWQTDWHKYVVEVGKKMVNLSPGSAAWDRVFEGKVVTWEGQVAETNKTRKPGKDLVMNMPATEIEVPVSRFPGRQGRPGKLKSTVTSVDLRMTLALEMVWATVPIGSRIRFRARLPGLTSVMAFTVGSKDGEAGGLLFTVDDAQPLKD